MTITINETDYEVIFGMAFVRALDEKYYVATNNGAKFGAGLETTLPFLLSGDMVTLSDYLYLGTGTEKKRPTQKEIDGYIDQVEDIDALFEEVIQALKKQNATKKKMLAMTSAIEAEEKELQKMALKKG